VSEIDPAQTFRQEARELLEQLELVLLDLAQTPGDRELIDAAFRALHTLKGSGAMFGFADVAEFVHDFETAFDRLRKGETTASPRLIGIALEAKDHVDGLIFGEASSEAGGAILAALREELDLPGAPDDATTTTTAPATSASAAPPRRWRVRFRLPADALVYGTNPLLLLGELAAIGPATVRALTDAVPALAAFDPEQCYLGWEVELLASDPQEAIGDVFLFVGDDIGLSVEPLDGDPLAPEAEAPMVVAAAAAAIAAPAATRPAAEAKPHGAADPSSSLRVPAERLDALMDQVGELVIAQTRLSQIAAAVRHPALATIAEELERLSSGLRDTSMGIRMVPIGSLFGRFRRLTHDLSRELGKEIDFVTAGEETELDKTVIERIADPLVHLIRNAVDHGLEDVATRLAAGKPARGTVRLSAAYVGAEIAITLTDDGAGINAARVRAKAVENGLIAADAALSDEETFALIFAPGFSTAEQVTSLSGRGVGMDVVKRTIEGLRGSIDVASRPGQGSTVTLRLPLTLAILDGMLVRVGDARYSIPLGAVEECLELPLAEVEAARGRSFLDIRGQLVPYLRLADLFGSDGPRDPHQKVVVVSSGDTRVGLVIDQILGNHQIVIKQLSRFHAGVRRFSGATILGDGSVALILDVPELIDVGQCEAPAMRRAA
jgi:two-component system chemotaxis sensor kinase CheA